MVLTNINNISTFNDILNKYKDVQIFVLFITEHSTNTIDIENLVNTYYYPKEKIQRIYINVSQNNDKQIFDKYKNSINLTNLPCLVLILNGKIEINFSHPLRNGVLKYLNSNIYNLSYDKSRERIRNKIIQYFAKIMITMKELVSVNSMDIYIHKTIDTYLFDLINKKEEDKNKNKKDKNKNVSKKDLIIMNNNLKKEKLKQIETNTKFQSTLLEIKKDIKNESLNKQKIIQYIKRFDEVNYYKVVIIGIVIQYLLKNNFLSIALELIFEWYKLIDEVNISSIKKDDNSVEYKNILDTYKTEWNNTKTFLNKELQKFKNENEYVEFYLNNVALSSNSLVEFSTNIINIYDWQKEFLQLLYNMCFSNSKGGKDKSENIFIHSVTTSGKTFTLLSIFKILVSHEWKIIYVGATETLAIQSLSLLYNLTDGKINSNIYTSSLFYNVHKNPEIIFTIPLFDDGIFSILETEWKNKKILFITDEFHLVNNIDYLNTMKTMAKYTNNIILCTATIDNMDQTIKNMEQLYAGKSIKIVGTPIRPVRMEFYTETNKEIHPWCNNNRNKGLSAKDLLKVLKITSEEKLLLIDSNEYIEKKYAKINLSLCESIENKILSLGEDKLNSISEKLNTSLSICKGEGDKSGEIDLSYLYNLLHTYANEGNILLFTKDPKQLITDLVIFIKNKIKKEFPYWDDIVSINMEFKQAYNKLITKEYLDTKLLIENSEEDQKIDSKYNKVQSKIDELIVERKSKLNKLEKNYLEDLVAINIISKEKNKKEDVISELYEPLPLIKFGTYIPILSKFDDDISFITTYGISYISDDLNDTRLSQMATRINLLLTKRLTVLIIGKDRLSVGINLPIKIVIINDPKEEFTVNEIKQMSGRAGRKGLDTIGKTIIISKNSNKIFK